MTPRASGGGQKPITLTLPLPPNIANARQHWRVKLKAKKAYWRHLDLLYGAGYFGPWKCPTECQAVQVRAHVVVGGQMDVDNLFARLKWALDWLQLVGYLADDSPKYLHWASIPTQEIRRTQPPTVTLTLTPLPSTPAPGASHG